MQNTRIISLFILLFCSCKKSIEQVSTRTYRMGFQNSAPKLDMNLYLQALGIWTTRGDAAMITTEVPWDSLYAGMKPETYIINNYKALVSLYRQKQMKLWIFIDPGNGLDRTTDAIALIRRHKSIAQTDVQLIYRRFSFLMDSILKPDHLGLALETNLIRMSAPDSIYQGIKQAAQDAAAEIKAADPSVTLSISIQVEAAWGRSMNNIYQGIAKDLSDFSFIRELGLSSYPYFSFDNPVNIPPDYYSRIGAEAGLRVFVSEGGWSSQTVSSFSGSPQKQADYIMQQGRMLNAAKATALFQLSFTDIDISSLPPGTPANIDYFAFLGMVDIFMRPKPALASWDSLFKQLFVY